MNSEFQSPPSLEREYREKSQSDERSVSQGLTGLTWTGGKGKVSVEVEYQPSDFTEAVKESDATALGYQIRPKFGEKFSETAVKAVIQTVITDYFHNDIERKQYDHEKAQIWVEELSKQLTNRVRQLNYPRYRLVSHVAVGEHIGGGVHIGLKGLWDAETDSYATYSYVGEYLYCVGTVCGIYSY